MTVIEQHDRHVADLVGVSLGTFEAAYTERDAILYALAVGSHATERELVDERRLRVLSTYALPLGLWAVEAAGRLGTYDPVKTLHVGQHLAVHAPLPPSGTVEMQGHVAAVWDKKAAALVEIVVSSRYFYATYGIWVPGAGGFGGERGPSASPPATEGPPDLARTVETTEDQAALYRLTGDLHPLHIDPDVAAQAGFDRPILHGLCVLGVAALELARGMGADPSQVHDLAVRFAAPVYPGASIDVRGWAERPGRAIGFSAAVGDADVLKAGSITFRPAGR